jgi:hypothetical protein
MAHSIGISTDAAAPLVKTRVRAGFSTTSIRRRWVAFLERQRDRDIERYIQERGGVLTDGMERALERNMYKGTHWQ